MRLSVVSGHISCYSSCTSAKCSTLSSLLRLEFNSGDCGYYTELDGVELHGYTNDGMF